MNTNKSMVDKMLTYNQSFVENELYKRFQTSKYPDKKIAILTCMDTRLIELLPAALGIKNGDIKMIKNAGGILRNLYGSVMYSFIVSVYELGVDTIMIIGHDDCGVQGLNADKLIEEMKKKGISQEAIDKVYEQGIDLKQWLKGFETVEQSVQDTVKMVKEHPLIHKDVTVLGFIMNPETGALREA